MQESMTGEEIQALVNKLPPITPGSVGRAVQAVAILLGILSIIVVSLRIYVRAGFSGAASRLWGVEDYVAVIGTVSLRALAEPLFPQMLIGGANNSFHSYQP